MKFVNDNEEELLPHSMEYVTCGMQTITGGKQKTLKHNLESLEVAVELWMYEHHDCTETNVDFAIWHLNLNMLQDIPKCHNNLNVSEGHHCLGNIMATL